MYRDYQIAKRDAGKAAKLTAYHQVNAKYANHYLAIKGNRPIVKKLLKYNQVKVWDGYEWKGYWEQKGIVTPEKGYRFPYSYFRYIGEDKACVANPDKSEIQYIILLADLTETSIALLEQIHQERKFLNS